MWERRLPPVAGRGVVAPIGGQSPKRSSGGRIRSSLAFQGNQLLIVACLKGTERGGIKARRGEQLFQLPKVLMLVPARAEHDQDSRSRRAQVRESVVHAARNE